ncbi:aldehyde dehydrogenase (NADP(+)) [Lysobacter sp. CA199]|uniref:aldehyde dehydrogenase (NADP(+)) n=1 Tax=Lysobacter sp. CA199 TaxID=3455608 RepID=UPI003F8D84AC
MTTDDMPITGDQLIGLQALAGDPADLRGVDPAAGTALEPAFSAATADQIDRACALAAFAFDPYRALPLPVRADFLEAIANEIIALGDALIERAHRESGLPTPRLNGERDRTVNQLRLFAQGVRSGAWQGVRVDSALPQRQPLPRPDLRQWKIPLGPVAVFGSSNFPLAFSVAGGDTASALAAGCPVVVKAHPAHPGTCELVGRAVQNAARKTAGVPEGVFSLLVGASNDLGATLVTHPKIQAVAFTGSRAGGLALAKLAATRPVPIPVYAEMSAVNPVYLLPAALSVRGAALAAPFVDSLTLGAGQFCTNPGLLFGIAGPDWDAFVAQAAQVLAGRDAAPMLTQGIHAAYERGSATLARHAGVSRLSQGNTDDTGWRAQPRLFATDAASFLADAALGAEVFGPSSLLVACQDENQLLAVSEALEGQLTATLLMDDGDLPLARRLLPVLERRVGRILANGFPTGVEVSHAMVHGGPYPATSDSRTTSVGTLALERFLRPVCYQNLPDALLPEALRHDNPLGLGRLVDGAWSPGS